jgi:hypothetical protein
VFYGTGGWDLEVFVTRSRGRTARVFSGRARDYDLSAGPGSRLMTFHLHGTFCGLSGPEDCVERRRIGPRPFAFSNR